MSMTNFMSLNLPVVSQTAGPAWAQSINNSLTLIDSHNHLPGYGAPIPSAALSIDSDLPFNSHNATLLRSIRLESQGSALSLATDLTCVYVSGSDLYYNDSTGNQVRLTANGAVNTSQSGSISGMGGTTATATYSSGSSKFNLSSATGVPAYLATGPLILSTNAASQHMVTLTPPGGLAADYTLTFPTGLPASTKIMTCDVSGNIGVSYDTDNSTLEISSNLLRIKAAGITTNHISATAGITGGQLASNIDLQGKLVTEQGKALVVSNTNPSTNSLAIVRASFNTSNTLLAGEGATAVYDGLVGYAITFSTPFLDTPVVVASRLDTSAGGVSVVSPTSTGVFVICPANVSIIAIGQRA